jgi:hypothetical protein
MVETMQQQQQPTTTTTALTTTTSTDIWCLTKKIVHQKA